MPVDSPPRRKLTPSERGVKAMRARWGPQRVVRLDQLDAVTANIIRTILTAREHAAEAAADVPREAA